MSTNNKGEELSWDIVLWMQKEKIQTLQWVFPQCVSSTPLKLNLASTFSLRSECKQLWPKLCFSENCRQAVFSLYQLQSRFTMHIKNVYESTCTSLLHALRSPRSQCRSWGDGTADWNTAVLQGCLGLLGTCSQPKHFYGLHTCKNAQSIIRSQSKTKWLILKTDSLIKLTAMF